MWLEVLLTTMQSVTDKTTASPLIAIETASFSQDD